MMILNPLVMQYGSVAFFPKMCFKTKYITSICLFCSVMLCAYYEGYFELLLQAVMIEKRTGIPSSL